MTTKPTFRYVPEHYGGFLNFVESNPGHLDYDPLCHEHVWLVGTHSCRTCFGLYIRIPLTRCPMIHIDADNQRRLVADQKAPGNREVSPKQGSHISQAVQNRLAVEAQNAGWTWDASQKVIICCPWPDHEGEEYAGRYVIEGTNKFLKRYNNPLHVEPWGGFVVNQKTGDLEERFRFDKARRLGDQPGIDEWNAWAEPGLAKREFRSPSDVA